MDYTKTKSLAIKTIAVNLAEEYAAASEKRKNFKKINAKLNSAVKTSEESAAEKTLSSSLDFIK